MAEHKFSRADAVLALDLFWRLSNNSEDGAGEKDSGPEHGSLLLESAFAAPDFEAEKEVDVKHLPPPDESHHLRAKTAIWIGCSVEAVDKKLAEYSTLLLNDKTGKHETKDDITEPPMRISATAREVWKEFSITGGDYDKKLLRDEARRIIKQRDRPDKISRQEVRRAAMQVLYIAQAQGSSAKDAREHLLHAEPSGRLRAALEDGLLDGITAAYDADADGILGSLSTAAGRGINMISAVECSIICAAISEGRAYPDTPRSVIINEAVEIAKSFGAEGGHKLVNAVLQNLFDNAKPKIKKTRSKPAQKTRSKPAHSKPVPKARSKSATA